MEKVKLVVPIRRLENLASNQLQSYDPEKIERIKVKDDINRLIHIKELTNINNDLNSLVKKIKIRNYISLMYQISILKIYLNRFLGKLKNTKKSKIQSFYEIQNHSNKKIDFNINLVQNQNLPFRSSNKIDLKMLQRTSKNQYFHKGGVLI